jgi:chromosome segregation ATPase
MIVEFEVLICRMNLEEAQEKLRKLCSDYQMVIKELQDFYEEQKNVDRHNNTYLEVQARGFTEKIDSLTAQLLNKEEALAQKEKEVTLLKEKVEKCELQKEAVTILKAQV